MKNNISLIKSSILSLTRKDLLILQQFISSLLEKTLIKEIESYSNDKDILLFINVINRNLDPAFSNFLLYKNPNLVKQVKNTTEYLNELLGKICESENIKWTIRLKTIFYYQYGYLTVQYCKEYLPHIPLSFKLVINQRGKFLDIIEQFFPSYLQNKIFIKSVLKP